ncbi:hypothetical protein [Xylanimonas cellulosilytica]|uniref:hypothetical protein n=1 Tax=Xylanimonas cellulosilytica TaxID=186189 RepID=UPI00066104C5|nr:hypothetical protein [Xylanimonas cellulosilytica]
MPDLNIIQGDLENFSHELRDLSTKVGGFIASPSDLRKVASAMEGGSSCQRATYAGEHMEDQLTALRNSFVTLADNVEAAANQFKATEEINQQAIQQVQASIPEPCPPVGPSKGE